MFEVSVVYILRAGNDGVEVLLGEKLTGLGVGKVVGPGGKQEPGETPEDTAVREVREEVGLTLSPENLVPLARITYPFVGRPELSQRSYAFVVREWNGEPRSSDEISPAWWAMSRLPLDRMWSDAALWLPRALQGEYLEATFEIGQADQVLSQQMTWMAREAD